MANPPTDDGYLDIADLLESEELKAKEKIAQQKAGASSNGNDDERMGGTTPDLKGESSPSSRDPLRLDRPSDSDRHRGDKDRSKNGRYFNDREREDERRSRRHIKKEDEDSDSKQSANGSVRSSKRRSRSPKQEGRRDHRSRERATDSYRPGSGARTPHDDDERSYRPGRDRRGGRSRSPGRRGGRDDRDRRGRDRDGHSDRRSNYRGGDGGNKRKTPEPTDDERDRRTVFVQQLAARLRSRELKEFFEQVGGVVDAQIVKDRVSGRSKG